jgi:hypothetical protein
MARNKKKQKATTGKQQQTQQQPKQNNNRRGGGGQKKKEQQLLLAIRPYIDGKEHPGLRFPDGCSQPTVTAIERTQLYIHTDSNGFGAAQLNPGRISDAWRVQSSSASGVTWGYVQQHEQLLGAYGCVPPVPRCRMPRPLLDGACV